MRADTAARDVATLCASSGATAVSVLADITAALGTAPIEVWDARFNLALSGSAIISWAGLQQGFTITAPGVPNRPTRSVDGSNFLGKPLVKTIAASNHALNSGDLGAIIPVGGRPYVWIIARRVTVSGRLWQLNKNGTADSQVAFLLYDSGSAGLQRFTQSGGTAKDMATSMGTVASLFESWLDASVGERSATNGTEATPNALATAGVLDAIKYVCLNGVGGGASNGTTAFYAQLGISAAPPNAGQRAALLALRSQWGY